MRRLPLALVLFLAGPAAAQPLPPDAAAVERMRKDLTFLAGPECEGRGVGTAGLDKAADYVAAAFKAAGLKPAGKDGSYFQPFTMNGFPDLDGPSALAVAGPDFMMGFQTSEDFRPIGYSSGGKAAGGVAFVGHGVVAPNLKYDDYAGLDVKGKWVIIVRRTPRPTEAGAKRFDATVPEGVDSPYSALRLKLDSAAERKVAGVIFVSDPKTADDADRLIAFDDHKYADISARLPVLHLKRDLASKLLAAALGKTLVELEAENDKELKPVSAELKGCTVTAEVGVVRKEVPVKNVVGVLAGSGPLADETVVVGAHYDHLGYGSGPLSAGGAPAQGKVHYGADDNGSGTAGLLELARRFGAMADRRGRRLVFVAFTGEERGLFGSVYYCNHPAFPLARTAAMVNLDMIGRLRTGPGDWLGLTTKPRMVVYGTGTGDTFDRTVDAAETRYGLKILKVPGGIGRSDHESFYRKKVPVLFLFTGLHDQYHKPTDTLDTIDFPGMATVVGLTEDLVLDLGTTLVRPRYREQTGGFEDPLNPTPPRPGVRLGVRPDYAYMGADGMRIEGVTGGGAAEKGGLKEGDVIVEIGGVPVRSVNGYMGSLAGKKPGDTIEVVVLRGGKKVPLKVVP